MPTAALENPSAPAPAGLFGQTLHGQVGTLPVTLHLGRPSGDKHEVRAEYAYDRLGTAIMTFGNVQGDTIELWADGAKAFTLRQAGSALVGTWHGKGKSLPVRLE